MSATPCGPPDAPANLHATYGAGGKTTVSWKAPASNGGPITSYYVRWSQYGVHWSRWYRVGKTFSATHIGFQPGLKGYVRVMAANAAGKGRFVTLTVHPHK